MGINIISDQRTDFISPLSEVTVNQKTRVIQLPNTTSTTSLTSKMLLIAGLVTATGILFLNNYASQNAKVAADLQKECIVIIDGNQNHLYRATRLKIVECASQLATNKDLVEIYCGEEFVKKTINHSTKLDNLNCKGTINDEVKVVGLLHGIVTNALRYTFSTVSLPSKTLPEFLRNDLSDPDYYYADFIISSDCDRHRGTPTIDKILLNENSMWRKTRISAQKPDKKCNENSDTKSNSDILKQWCY